MVYNSFLTLLLFHVPYIWFGVTRWKMGNCGACLSEYVTHVHAWRWCLILVMPRIYTAAVKHDCFFEVWSEVFFSSEQMEVYWSKNGACSDIYRLLHVIVLVHIGIAYFRYYSAILRIRSPWQSRPSSPLLVTNLLVTTGSGQGTHWLAKGDVIWGLPHKHVQVRMVITSLIDPGHAPTTQSKSQSVSGPQATDHVPSVCEHVCVVK